MSWGNLSSIPLALLGEKGGVHRYKAKKTSSDSAGNVGRHAKSDVFHAAIWFPLADALRRFVVPPFAGPWTPKDEA